MGVEGDSDWSTPRTPERQWAAVAAGSDWSIRRSKAPPSGPISEISTPDGRLTLLNNKIKARKIKINMGLKLQNLTENVQGGWL